MQSYKSYLQHQGKTKSTIKSYEYYLLNFISWLDKENIDIDNVCSREIISYLDYLQKKGLENKTRSYQLGAIKHYYQWQIKLSEEGLSRTCFGKNPARQIVLKGTHTRKLYPILSKVELEEIYTNYELCPPKLVEGKNRNWYNKTLLTRKRNKVILSLLINQGLKTSEIKTIEVSDLKLREGKIYIKGNRKSNERELDLKPNQIIDLMEYTLQVRQLFINYYNEEPTNLFLSTPTATNTKVKNENSLDIFKSLTQQLKKENKKLINLNQIRASVIVYWLKKYHLREVQYKAGHKYVSSTESYLHSSTEDLQKAIEQMHPIG